MEKEEDQHDLEPRPVSLCSAERTTNQIYGLRRKSGDTQGDKSLNTGDHFEVPLREEKSNADGTADGEDGGTKRNKTDKDVNDFFRRMSGAMLDDESDAEDLAGRGDNASWDDLAGRAKRLNTPDKSGTMNDFAAIADKLIADTTFEMYK